MNWPWSPEARVNGLPPVPCPQCNSTQPSLSIVMLRNDYMTAKGPVSVVRGERKQCEACGCVYSIGPNGVFRKMSTPAPSNGPTERTPNRVEDIPAMPTPKARPFL